MRPLTSDERRLISLAADKLGGDDGLRLLQDLEIAQVSQATPDGSRIAFELSGYDRPAYVGQDSYRVEGTARDADGAELSIALYADQNGRLLELELIRWAEGAVQAPDWTSLQLF